MAICYSQFHLLILPMCLFRIQSWRFQPESNFLELFVSWFHHSANPITISPAQVHDVDVISISDTAHWTRRIHGLCTDDCDVDAALSLLHQLSIRGYQPDSLNISSIVHALCHAGRFAEAHHHLLDFVSANCAPDERTCNVLIARLLDGRDPFRTLRLINAFIAEKHGFVPSIVNYNRLLDGLCKLGRLEAAHWLLYHMMMRGHCPNVVSFTTLINGYSQKGDVRCAEKLFDEMSEREVCPNSLTYCCLISGVLRRREFEKGRKLIEKVWQVMGSEEDVQINNAAFSSLIKCLCSEGLFHEVFKIAENMPQGKNVLDELAYAQMIDSLCRFGMYNGAARIVYMMRKKDFLPSLVSYNSIVHGLCKDGDPFRAFQVLEEGMQIGYSPSEFTYTVLVEGLCREHDLAKAKVVLNLMLSKEGVDKTRIYNIYLRALRQLNNPTEFLNVLVSMLQCQCQPDIISLNTVINGFCKMGRVEDALQVLDDMNMGKLCAPDEVTYSTIIHGLLKVRKVEEALIFLHDVMPQKGFSPGVVTYNVVLRGLLKLGLVNEAVGVLDKMCFSGVVANCRTYTIVIEGLCDACLIDEAKKFWNCVAWPSGVHDNFVYAALLKGLCRADNLDEAFDLLYELADNGVALNNVNYNIVLDYTCKLGLKREALQVVDEMRRNDVKPDAVTWRILDRMRGIG